MSGWQNPPPPGEEYNEEHTTKSSTSGSKMIDVIDPYLKNPEYVKYKSRYSGRRYSRSRSKSRDRRSRSKSYDRYRRRRYRSRSRDRGHRRSRTRSRNRRRERSSSDSRESSYERSRYKHRRNRELRRCSRSRSKLKQGRSEVNLYKQSSYSDREDPFEDVDESEVGKVNYAERYQSMDNDMREEEQSQPPNENVLFKNDGSFLEMFKKMQEEKARQEAEQKAAAAAAGQMEEESLVGYVMDGSGTKKPPSIPAFGKRRGGRILKTGMVQKVKVVESENEPEKPKDPWSIYLQEVKKYKEACCDDDSKTRPLVK